MATAAEGLLKWALLSSMAGPDSEIERRPYHRNCGCALHAWAKPGSAAAAAPCNKISYPVRGSSPNSGPAKKVFGVKMTIEGYPHGRLRMS